MSSFLNLRRWLSAATVAAGLAAAVVAGPAHAAFTSLTVFGDSLSDSGNNALVIGSNAGQVITGNTYIPSQPYAYGAYTNQFTWVNAFSAGLGLPSGAVPSLAGGGNYAYGGARTTVDGDFGGFPFPPSAATQLGQFLATPGALPASALFVIAIGGNDVRATAAAVQADPGNALSIISAGAASFASGVGYMVDALQARGAQNIVVWDAPDLGRSPFAIATGTVDFASFISDTFNSALGARLGGEAGVISFDVAALIDDVADNPGAFGLDNVTDACGAIVGCDPSKYLFWDGIHPTSAGHALLAGAMLAAVPEPSALLLMLAGLVAVSFMARRRRATAVAPSR
jgi:outer membrane lipase/esterase